MDKLKAMSMLIKVTEVGSFSAASKNLNIPLSTLSRKISELEDEIGVRLLHRTTRKLTLTTAGAEYINTYIRILEQAEEADRKVRGEYSDPRGDLLLTAPIMFGRMYVIPIVTEFLALYRNINVQLLLSDGNINLFEDDVDMAIRIDHLPDSSMIATQVGEIRMITCANEQVLTHDKKIESPADITNFPCILFNTVKLMKHWTYRQPSSNKEIQINITPRLTVNDSESAVMAAINGIGLTQQLHYQVKDALDKRKLKIVLPEFEPKRKKYKNYNYDQSLPSKL